MKQDKPPKLKRKGHWLRRIGWTLATLILLLALFHRPLVFRGTKYLLVRLAKEQKLDLSYDISGSIFTTLTVVNLHAKPTEPGPVERLEVGTLNLRYSLVGLIRKGLPGLLKDLDLRDAYVVVDPAKSVPREKAVKEQKGAKFPALFPERVNLQNINFISRSPTGDTELAGLYFNLDPVVPGVLKIKTLNIPGVRKWDGIAAGATFRDRDLVLSDLALGPEIALKRLYLNASKLDADEVTLGLDGVLFGAPTTLAVKVTDLNETNRFNVRMQLAGLSFDAATAYLHLTLPLHGMLTRATIIFDGVPDRPNTWAGKIETQLDALAFDKQALGAVSAQIDLGNGRATVAVGNQFDARNSIALNADAALPETLDGFVKTSASGRLEVKAPDLATITKALPLTADGDLSARVDFKLNDGQVNAKVAIDSARLAAAGAELMKTHIAMDVEKNIAANAQPVFADLVTHTSGSIGSVKFGDYSADGVVIALRNRGVAVTLEKLALTKASNSVSVQGSYTVPDDLKSWDNAPLVVSVDLTAPDLGAFVKPESPTKLAGGLTVRGRAETVNRKYNGNFAIAGKAVSFNGLVVRDLGGDVNIVNGVAYLPNLAVYLDAQNYLNLGGEIAIDPPMKYRAWIETVLKDLSAFAPLLSTPKKKQLGGALSLSWRGQGEVQPAKHSGSATLDLARGKFAKQENLSAHLVASYSPETINITELRAAAKQGTVQGIAKWENRRLVLHDLSVRQGERTVISGAVDVPLDLFAAEKTLDVLLPLDAPIKAELRSKDVDLKTLFEQLGQRPRVTGIVSADITASGSRRNLAAAVRIVATKLQPASAKDFTPADIGLDLTLKDSRLRLDTKIVQQKVAWLEGTAELPFDIAHADDPALLIPENEPLKVLFTSRNLSLARLLDQAAKLPPPGRAAPKPKSASFKKPTPSAPALTGTLDTTISAEGTMNNLIASVNVRASKVQSSAAAKLAPADLKLDLGFRDNRLKLNATVTQRDIKPLTIAGELPLDLAALRNGKVPAGNTPLALTMNLPRSPLGFVATVVPAIRFVDGTAAIDVKVGGTIAKPEFSGSMQADIPHLLLKETSQPPVNGVVVRIDFTRDQIAIRQFKGGLAGGTFGVSGRVNVAKITEPVFDLRITTREALVVQNDSVTARVTSDLRITGPMNAGTVSGSVLVTKSRFFKDIDILPIGLPGRPAPRPPAEPAPVSFASSPLRDWKFDVAIKTNDPVLIQGNLANGRTVLDLKLAGTGLKPWLDGYVRIEELMTSLPFSRLEVTSGNIYFTAAKPFVPQLDIRGQSTIRDYRVNVFISGDASAPQALFTSDPPLPQAEIVSLIATGATTQELTDDPNALAGRAGLLVAQKLYRKLFKKNEPSQPKDTLFRNVQFDVGAPDPHSGQQSVQLRMPLGDRLVLSGGVDVGGNFRGQLKYLIKFK